MATRPRQGDACQHAEPVPIIKARFLRISFNVEEHPYRFMS